MILTFFFFSVKMNIVSQNTLIIVTAVKGESMRLAR